MIGFLICYFLTGFYLLFCGWYKDYMDGYVGEWKEYWFLIPVAIAIWPYYVWKMTQEGW